MNSAIVGMGSAELDSWIRLQRGLGGTDLAVDLDMPSMAWIWINANY